MLLVVNIVVQQKNQDRQEQYSMDRISKKIEQLNKQPGNLIFRAVCLIINC
jgi:hypothetical protein